VHILNLTQINAALWLLKPENVENYNQFNGKLRRQTPSCATC